MAKPIGSGILLQPTGMRVMKELGLLESALEYGQRIDRLYGHTDRHFGKPWKFSQQVHKCVLDLQYKYLGEGYYGLGIHRGTLFELLFNQVSNIPNINVKCGMEVCKIEENQDSARLYFKTPEGKHELLDQYYDMVIISTGTHSKLGNFENRLAKPYEFGSLWGNAIDNTGYSNDRTLYQKYRNANKMSGLLPIGKCISSPKDNLVSIFWSLTQKDYMEFQKLSRDGIDFMEWKQSLVDFWPSLEPFISQITSKDQLTYATYNDVQMSPDNWVTDRVVTIGDYCHGTSPQLGQGCSLAFVDAHVLNQCLEKTPLYSKQAQSNYSLKQALAEYRDKRMSHVIGYRLASRILTPFFQSNFHSVSYMRDIVMGPLCNIQPARWFMLRTLAGIQSGWFDTFDGKFFD
ncbi:predicted protein [Naegleria gruberi]|uniref:Predicted protein n=1 Tax=Naegleria gruberi TaxID=5762 RepID=D2V2N4_NAEGR|nr:uncharacterized protein NAEGRDRAFT_46205 [Naegleria gruberi]EFC49092.1 predicted protein [Naegleria gruberi]|eukprot:XP_002681836.1 predicted protein [Naegleria gruberi strain NEG-M]